MADEEEQCGRSLDGHDYRWQWENQPTRSVKNKKGRTGWGKISASTDEARPVNDLVRFHLCAHSPCQAWWEDNKYGLQGPCVHIQAGPPPDALAAVAALTGSPLPSPVAVELAAVSSLDAASSTPVVQPSAPVATAPVEETEPALQPVPLMDPAPAMPPTVAPAPVVTPAPLVAPSPVVEQAPVEAAAVAAHNGSQLPPPAAVESAAVSSVDAAPSTPVVQPLAPVATAPVEETEPALQPLPLMGSALAQPPIVTPTELVAAAEMEPAPVEAAAVEEQPSVEAEPVPALVPEAKINPPIEAALQCFKPPAPSLPIDVIALESDLEDNACAAMTSSAVVAQRKVLATLLALARQIRTPCAYVGYSAFILFGLVYKCQPCLYEGRLFIDLLETFAPWAKECCPKLLPVRAIPCALIAKAGGSAECAPISVQHPLNKTCHYVACIPVPGTAVAEMPDWSGSFELFYTQLGLAVLATVINGDCGFDVMDMMLGRESTLSSRSDVRIAISDYLLTRISEPWMHELMVACQELEQDDVAKLVPGYTGSILALSIGSPSAVAAPVEEVADPAEEHVTVQPDEETFAAIRWVSKLGDDHNVLSLIRSLPAEIVDEQVRAYRQRGETAVAVLSTNPPKLKVGAKPTLCMRMKVSARYHKYRQSNGIPIGQKLPYGVMLTFMEDHLEWKACQRKMLRKNINKWYNAWQRSEGHKLSAVADTGSTSTSVQAKSRRGSRANVPYWKRRRCEGVISQVGREKAAPLVGLALYEWWSGLRYAIDWTQLAEDRRSRGRKYLARFPRAVLVIKCRQLLEDQAYACLINGSPVQSFVPDSHWFNRWEDEHGLSMRMANRKYEVPRKIQKERLEVMNVNLFRIRQFILLEFGYDPDILNWDQSPFHHNESGAQDKRVVAVVGSKVPIVQGHTDSMKRWTANLTTQRNFGKASAVAGNTCPPAECMFKAAKDGPVNDRLQAFLRSRGFPKWFTVTVGPKGSYREDDIISFLRKHLDPWTDGRDWRIILADDYVCHKTQNVWALCWSRGYILLIHGGGCTPVSQTPDTDLNQHVRRRYGGRESRILIEKMRNGEVVPKLTNEECMTLMFEVLSDVQLHKDAADGYKKVGQSVDLHGSEDSLLCREAATFWNEETTDGYKSMRPRINFELAAVAEEHQSGGLQWCERDVKNLITPYTPRKDADRVLANLGEDFYYDALHHDELSDADDDTAVAAGEASDETDDDADAGHVGSAVAEHAVADVDDVDVTGVELVHHLSAAQSDKVHQVQVTKSALELTIEGLKAVGAVRSVQYVEYELQKEKRKERALVKASPAVAEAFLRIRSAETQADILRARQTAQQKDRKREALKAVADLNSAVAELAKTRRLIKDVEGAAAAKHAIKTFTLDALGDGEKNAGGVKAKKCRLEVLDRLARFRAGLSVGQKNDFPWFKENWDQAMVTAHGKEWAKLFSAWVQGVLNDERSNAFSLFVFNESQRVFNGTSALHVPG
jgi:hypothetical protein